MRSTYTVLVPAASKRNRWLGFLGAIPTGWLAATSTLVVGMPLALTFSFYLFAGNEDYDPLAGQISPEQLAELTLPDLPEDVLSPALGAPSLSVQSAQDLQQDEVSQIAESQTGETGAGEGDEETAEATADARDQVDDPSIRTIRMEKGDTLLGLLASLAIPEAEAHDAMSALSKVYNPRNLRAGDELTVNFDRTGVFSGFEFDPDAERSVKVLRNENGEGFNAASVNRELSSDVMAATARIDSSLYEAGIKAGIPAGTMGTLIKALSHTIDFQRDIHTGDTMRVLYEVKRNSENVIVKTGRVLFAEITVNGKTLPVYLYRYKDGNEEYFDGQGKSFRKSLLRTPVNGARISSGYGMRRHPVLGYSKMHRGVDFGAPTGTNIYASGDGVIVERGRKGSYGNYIRIRHNGTLSTAYAHMSRFASGLKVGSRVRQGDVIGYVGTTGRSTGPHLHYEVLINGTQVNPLRVANLSPAESLKGNDLVRFKELVHTVAEKFRNVESGHAIPVSYRLD